MKLLLKLQEPFFETLLLTIIPLILSVIFGFIIGTLIFITADSLIIDISKNKFLKIVNRISDGLVNIFRSIPYLILLIWVIPVAKILTGSMLGWKAAVPSLVISATPFFARMTVVAFQEVDKGTIEASKSLGASTLQIIIKVLLPESKPALISAITITAINLISYSAMAGAVGAGGLGFEAYQYGLARPNPPLMYLATLLIVIIVFVTQFIGDYFVKKVDKR